MGMQSEAARPKGERAFSDPAYQEPMKGGKPSIRRNPSTDQKKTRRRINKAATVLQTQVDKLNPGDHIRTPTGQTIKVTRVRSHPTSGQHVIVDTEGGSTQPLKRNTPIEVVPHNSRQQELPGYGVPGGNSNWLPFDPHGPSGNNEATPRTQCPTCGRGGTLHRIGDHYACANCGYTENVGAGSGVGYTTNNPNATTHPHAASQQGAIARRARMVLDAQEGIDQ